MTLAKQLLTKLKSINESSKRITNDEAYKIEKFLTKLNKSISSLEDYDRFLEEIENEGFDSDHIDREIGSSQKRLFSKQNEESVAEIIELARKWNII